MREGNDRFDDDVDISSGWIRRQLEPSRRDSRHLVRLTWWLLGVATATLLVAVATLIVALRIN